jgi:aquaporin Z
VFGLIVLAMIYTIGDISGAHINPAVTLGFWSVGRFPGNAVAGYLLAQSIGAFTAAVLLKFLFPESTSLGATHPSGTALQSCVLEGVLTFLLMFVVLSVSTGAKEKGITAGIVVGAVIALEALFAGPICGASMNPIRSLAPAVMSGAVGDIWIYFAGPIGGALLAGVVFGFMQSGSGNQHAQDANSFETTAS